MAGRGLVALHHRATANSMWGARAATRALASAAGFAARQVVAHQLPARNYIAAHVIKPTVVAAPDRRHASTTTPQTTTPEDIKAWASRPKHRPTPGDLLRQQFVPIDEAKCPLFRDWETYAASLPVRKRNTKSNFVQSTTRLHELPHWSRDVDVEYMAKQLEVASPKSISTRNLVKYVCAPTGAGKTKSILPAFLKSHCRRDNLSFTHYVYIAFHNNDSRNFKTGAVPPILDKDKNEESEVKNQGAEFMLEVLTAVLTKPATHAVTIPVSANPRDYKATLEQVNALLDRCFGTERFVLIHVDEHAQMTGITGERRAWFSHGAMSVAADAFDVRVVATYVQPPSLDANGSSGVCRDPVGLPRIDPSMVLEDVLGLKLLLPTNKEQRRQHATLMFILSLILLRHVTNVHNLQHPDAGPVLALLSTLKNCLDRPTPDYVPCLREGRALVSELLKKAKTKDEPNALRLLVGIEDESDSKAEIDRRFEGALTLPPDIVTANIIKLLSWNQAKVAKKDENQEFLDEQGRVYATGRNRLKSLLSTSNDLLSGKPLEEAYTWCLACTAATAITLHPDTAQFRNTKLQPARIFRDRDINMSSFTYHDLEDLSFLQRNVMYYAKEQGRDPDAKTSHPRADIFYITDWHEVIFVDISGGSSKGKLEEKVGNLIQSIVRIEEQLTEADEQGMFNNWKSKSELLPPSKWTWKGVVLAPFFPAAGLEEVEVDVEGVVYVLCGEDALELLGGLRQMAFAIDEAPYQQQPKKNV